MYFNCISFDNVEKMKKTHFVKLINQFFFSLAIQAKQVAKSKPMLTILVLHLIRLIVIQFGGFSSTIVISIYTLAIM